MEKGEKKYKKKKSFFFKDYPDSEINFANLNKKTIVLFPNRINLLLFIFSSLIFIFSIKIIYLSLFPEKNLFIEKKNYDFVKQRADIIDANGVILARSIDIYSAGIVPKLVKDKKKTINKFKTYFSKYRFK